MRNPRMLLLIVMGLVSAVQVFAAGPFKKPVLYAVGVEPQQVVVADLNHDGKLDLVTADFTSLDISILLGNGDGTFQAATQFATFTDPAALAVGDFNGDGNPDLAVTEYGFGGPGYLQIFLGNGDGTFTLKQTYTIGSLPYDITVADFNGDGKLDLATANSGINNIGVMLGNGNGTFQPAVTYASPLPERVLAVDLNGDGHPDLVSLAYCGPNPKVCKSGAVQVFLNNGDGTFGVPTFFTVNGVGSDGVAAADFNRDGIVDLVVANNNYQAPSSVSVFLGNGDGTFKPVVNYTVGGGPAGIAIADFNGDGKPDIAVANTGTNSVSLLYGKGDGTFRPARNLSFAVGSLPISVAAADLNGDAAPDLAVVLDYANEVAILINAR